MNNIIKIISYLLITGGFFIFCLPFSVNATNVVINEIMYDLPGIDTDHEWIEILNISDTEIDLTNWKFNDGSNHNLNEPPKNGGQGLLKISAGEYTILTGDATTFLTDHPGFSGTVIDTVMSLKNTNATLKILDLENNEIDSIAYESIWGANGDWKTLEKIDSQGTNTQNNWQISVLDGGTPGILNSSGAEIVLEDNGEETSIESTTSGVPIIPVNQPPVAYAGTDITALINQEIIFDGSLSSDSNNDALTYFWNFGDGATDIEQISKHTYLYPGQYIISLLVDDGEFSDLDIITINIYNKSIIISEFLPDPEGTDAENEWIELYNQSNQIANLSNWQLDDQEEGSLPFIFPANSLIGPNQFLVLIRSITKIALNNDNDQVRLIYPDGSLAAEINYLAEKKEGFSIAFDNNDYFWTKIPTPGSANIISSIGLDLETENLSKNNPEPIIQQSQEMPDVTANTNLNQSQSFDASEDSPSLSNKELLSNISSVIQNNPNDNINFTASLGQSTQLNQKSKLILYLSIIISGSLLLSWIIIQVRKTKKILP